MSRSPKHIRVPKHKNDLDLRYSTKSQLSSIKSKNNKKPIMFDPPVSLEKNFFSKKIKKTVKHYFQARRTSMGNNFNVYEFSKDKSFKNLSESMKAEPKRHNFLMELDKSIDLSEKATSKEKAVSHRASPKGFILKDSLREREVVSQAKETKDLKEVKDTKDSKELEIDRKIRPSKAEEKKEVKLLEITAVSLKMVDQGLQTDEGMTNLTVSVKKNRFISPSIAE